MKKFNKNNKIFSCLRLRQILNDLKRRPEDAAADLNMSIANLKKLLTGEKALDEKIVRQITSIWPIRIEDLINPYFNKEPSFRIMRVSASKKTSRIMQRGGIDYYEYRDTAMSKGSPFFPEWIRELNYVENNNVNNKSLRWNRGHLLHQFTYFIGEVNFYYLDKNKKKKVAVMNTGDTMCVGPYVPHTFASRNKKCNGFIIAITYEDKITTEIQNELINIGEAKSLNFFDKAQKSNIDKVTVLFRNKTKTKNHSHNKSIIFKTRVLASTKLVKSAKSFEIEVIKNNKYLQQTQSHQYIYILSEKGEISFENKIYKFNKNDTIYIKPYTEHAFLSKGLRAVVMQVEGKISGDTKLQLIQFGKKNLKRIMHENMSWFKSK